MTTIALDALSRRFRSGPLVLTLGSALMLAAPAAAEWRIETRTTDGSGSAQSGRIYLDGDDLRLESDGDDAGAIVYQGDGPALLHLDAETRSYVLMDRETASQVSQQLDSARRAMELQLQGLPAEQRAALERMLPQAQRPESRPELEVVRTDRTREVDGRSCRVRELRRDETLTGELCVIDWKAAGIGRSDLRAFRDMARFQQDLLREAAGPFAPALGSQPFDAFEKLDGYPVESRTLTGRGTRTTMSLPAEHPTDASRFRVPDGWTRRALMPGR